MNLTRLFTDTNFLEQEINFFLTKNHLRTIPENKSLITAHLDKAKHNLEFYKLNKDYDKFLDWLIVTLYYATYHCALALLTKKKYASKNHYATLLILIKEYNISKDEAEFIRELSISREDAEFYTALKKDRHNASYSTHLLFDKNKIKQYENKVIDFINKTEEILENT